MVLQACPGGYLCKSLFRAPVTDPWTADSTSQLLSFTNCDATTDATCAFCITLVSAFRPLTIAVDMESDNLRSTSGCKVICCKSDVMEGEILLSSWDVPATTFTSDEACPFCLGFFDMHSSGKALVTAGRFLRTLLCGGMLKLGKHNLSKCMVVQFYRYLS